MEQEGELNVPRRNQVPLDSYCSSCFNVPQVRCRSISEPPRLEDLALQAIASIIDGYTDAVLEDDHCSALEDINAPSQTDLVEDTTLTILRRHAHEELNWTSTEMGLKFFLNCLAAIESEYKKSVSDEHKLSTFESNQNVELVKALKDYKDKHGPLPVHIYSVIIALFKYLRENKHTEFNDWYQLFEKLRKIPGSLQILQRSKDVIQKFLNTGPHKCLDEKKCEFLQSFVEQVPQVFANQLTELLRWPLVCITAKDKRVLETLVLPAVTRIQVPNTSNLVGLHLFRNIVPKLKLLQQITLTITVMLNNGRRYLDQTEYLILTRLSKNCSHLKELRLHLIPEAIDSFEVRCIVCELWQKLVQLPASLKLLKCHGNSNACTVADLNAMARSGKFSSLYCLSLAGMNCSIPLQTGFRRLVVMEIEKFFFESNFFLKDIGHQLRAISLSFVYMLKLQDLAKACPLLQILTVKNCSVFYDFQEPEPEFISLREFHFICNYFHASFDGLCIARVLKNSFQLQNLEIFTKDSSFCAGLEHLCKNRSISEVTEIELYRYDSKEAQGLLSREMVDQILKYCPYIKLMGGIETYETKIALSKIYPKITFLCVSQKLRKYCSAERLRFLKDKVVFLDVSDLDDYSV